MHLILFLFVFFSIFERNSCLPTNVTEFLSIPTTHVRCNSLEVISYNITPFVIFSPSEVPYAGLEYELLQTLAERLNLTLRIRLANVVKMSRVHEE